MYKGKGKFHPRTGNKGSEGEQKYISSLSLTSALDGVGGQCHDPAALLPGKRPGTHCTGGWVGPGVVLDVRKYTHSVTNLDKSLYIVDLEKHKIQILTKYCS
jgi:hypothetical protein